MFTRGQYLELAYQKMQDYYQSEKGNKRFETAMKGLSDLDQMIKEVRVNLQPIESLFDLFENEAADCFAAPGQAHTFKKDWNAFSQLESTKKIYKKLIELRIEMDQLETIPPNFYRKVEEAGLSTAVQNYKAQSGRPLLYVNRSLLMFFYPIFTSIADLDDLKNIAKKLGVPTNQSYEYMQRRIRECSEDLFKQKQLQVRPFFISVMPWFVNEITKKDIRKYLGISG